MNPSVDASAAKGDAESCPACVSSRPPGFVEDHLDRIEGRRYRLLRCPDCRVVYSDPREVVGPHWYEKAAPLRASESNPAPQTDWRFRTFFAERLPPGKLLDVGCGDGGFLMLAKARGFLVSGFDFDARMAAVVRSRGVADVEAAELGDYCRRRSAAEFDFITLFDVLEHSPEPAATLREVRRLLKPGGHMVITLPNDARPLPWGREEHDFPPNHFTRWTSQSMREVLERHGLRVVRQEAAHLRLHYLADYFFYRGLMPPLLSLARRGLFGASRSQTISDLYDTSAGRPAAAGSAGSPGLMRRWLSDKRVRQALADAFRMACLPLSWGAASLMAFCYRWRRADCGDTLYTLARLEDSPVAPPRKP